MKKSLPYLLLLIILISYQNIIGADTNTINWEQSFGENNICEKGVMVRQTNDHGYIILANKISLREDDIFISELYVIKLDKYGNEKWNSTYIKHESSGIYSCEGKDIFQTNNGGYIIIAEVERQALTYEEALQYGPEVWIVQIDQTGKEVKNQTFLTMRFEVGTETHDGGYVFSVLEGFWESDWILSLLKIDVEGEIEWKKTFDYMDNVHEIIQTIEGSYLVNSNFENNKGKLLQLNKNGAKEWESNLNFYDLNLCKELSDSYIFIGKKSNEEPFTIKPNYEINLIEINKKGVLLSNKTIGQINVNQFNFFDTNLSMENINLEKYKLDFSVQSISKFEYLFIVKRNNYYPSIIESKFISPIWIIKTDERFNMQMNLTIEDIPVESVRYTIDGGLIFLGLHIDGGYISPHFESSDVSLVKFEELFLSDDAGSNNFDDKLDNNDAETPGFELIYVSVASLIILLIYWKRKT
jgi:hypothetical protein